MKVGGRVDHGSRRNPLKFGANLDPEDDSGILRFFNITS